MVLDIKYEVVCGKDKRILDARLSFQGHVMDSSSIDEDLILDFGERMPNESRKLERLPNLRRGKRKWRAYY
jgi:hypothetical protein